MGNFKSNFATDNRVESTIHFINKYIRMKTNQIKTKKVDSDFFVVAGDTVEAVIKACQNRNAKTALVIDDLGLQLTNRLLQEGVQTITVVLARLPEEFITGVEAVIRRTFPNISCNIISMKELEEVQNEYDLIIANVPYGKIGADIVKKVRQSVKYKEWANLEPGNDYFTNDNYKYIDTSFKPVVLGTNAFADANQVTTLAKILNKENGLTATGARLLVSIQNKDEAIYKALSELWLSTESTGSLTFTRRRLKQDSNYFMFNSGGFDIIHGYFAVANGAEWTLSTLYNVFGKDAETLSGLPSSKIKGCLQFKKLIYSELGLKMIKLWFSSSPEGWGFGGKLGAGMFADIDYSDCLTWNDVFTKLNVSEDNQKILIEAAEKFELNDKEKEICKIVEETL